MPERRLDGRHPARPDGRGQRLRGVRLATERRGAPSPFPPIADYAFLSHCHTGELQAARDLMERLLGVASPLGLCAEEFDAATGRHLGNLPQAFSHLALLEAAARIILAERLAEYV